jgi:hypothetical protein
LALAETPALPQMEQRDPSVMLATTSSNPLGAPASAICLRRSGLSPVRGVVARWRPVSKTISGKPVRIIAYQLIIEKDV